MSYNSYRRRDSLWKQFLNSPNFLPITFTAGIIIISISLGYFFSDHTEPKYDEVSRADHAGAIETNIEIRHIDDLRDLLITTHTIWANDTFAGVYNTYDTLPSLGRHITTSEDNEGHEQSALAPREYEVYVTVK